MPDSKLKHIGYVLGQIWKGVKEDITHEKAVLGVGKWNDMIDNRKKKKQAPKPATPWKTYGKKSAEDIKKAVSDRDRAAWK